eukprot:g1070.t1
MSSNTIEGLLLKQGNSGLRWNPRYFKLDIRKAHLSYWELDDYQKGHKSKNTWALKSKGTVRTVDSNTCYNLPSDRKHPRQYVFEVLIGGEAVCCMCAEDDAQTKLWISSLRDAIRGENIKPVAATPVDDGVSTVSAATKSTKVDSTFQRGLPSPVKSKVTKDVKGPYWYVGLSCLKNTNAKVLGSFGAAGSSTGLRRRRDVRFSIDYGWERNVIRDATAANEAEKQRQIKIKERAEARKKEIAKAAAAAKERREKEEEERRKKEEERRKKE